MKKMTALFVTLHKNGIHCTLKTTVGERRRERANFDNMYKTTNSALKKPDAFPYIFAPN